MKKQHIYHAGEPATELRVELTRCRRFTAVVAIAASVYDEESRLYTVTEQADSAPHPANYGAIVPAQKSPSRASPTPTPKSRPISPSSRPPRKRPKRPSAKGQNNGQHTTLAT